MKTRSFKAVLGVLALALVSTVGLIDVNAQDSPQKAVASKTAKFESVAKTDAAYTGALDAHDKAAAAKLTGKDGAFKGTVTKVFVTRDGGILILNFDRDYKSALTAVLKKADFGKFPDMSQLDGKEIVVSGKFTDFHDSPQIVLMESKQIAVVK